MTIKVHAWYGDGDINPTGPLEAELVEVGLYAEANIRIIDSWWLGNIGNGENDLLQCQCRKLPSNNYVSRDAYAWCYIGECNLNTRWWIENGE